MENVKIPKTRKNGKTNVLYFIRILIYPAIAVTCYSCFVKEIIPEWLCIIINLVIIVLFFLLRRKQKEQDMRDEIQIKEESAKQEMDREKAETAIAFYRDCAERGITFIDDSNQDNVLVIAMKYGLFEKDEAFRAFHEGKKKA